LKNRRGKKKIELAGGLIIDCNLPTSEAQANRTDTSEADKRSRHKRSTSETDTSEADTSEADQRSRHAKQTQAKQLKNL
jgi:hypothetical protein